MSQARALAHDHYKILNMPVLAVGAAFDFIAGAKPQAPHWLQSVGLEWLFPAFH